MNKKEIKKRYNISIYDYQNGYDDVGCTGCPINDYCATSIDCAGYTEMDEFGTCPKTVSELILDVCKKETLEFLGNMESDLIFMFRTSEGIIKEYNLDSLS